MGAGGIGRCLRLLRLFYFSQSAESGSQGNIFGRPFGGRGELYFILSRGFGRDAAEVGVWVYRITEAKPVITVKVSVTTVNLVISGNLSSGPALEGGKITAARVVPKQHDTSENPTQG